MAPQARHWRLVPSLPTAIVVLDKIYPRLRIRRPANQGLFRNQRSLLPELSGCAESRAARGRGVERPRAGPICHGRAARWAGDRARTTRPGRFLAKARVREAPRRGLPHGASDGFELALPARLRRHRARARQGHEVVRRRLSAVQHRARRRAGAEPEKLRITLAVAGFARDQIEVTIEENQLTIRGRQQEDKTRNTCTAASPRGSSSAASCSPRACRCSAPTCPRVAFDRSRPAAAGADREEDRDLGARLTRRRRRVFTRPPEKEGR